MEISIDLNHLKKAIEYLESKPVVQYNPYPEYEKCVYDVLYSLGTEVDYFSKHNYICENSKAEMSFEDLRVMYTFILRGERYSLGFIGTNIEDGTILLLAKREYELILEMTKQQSA